MGVEFAVNEEKKMVRFTVGKENEEVTFKYALQFATKVIDALTGGSKIKMVKIMNG